MSRILAINRYMDIVMGVTQWPEIPLKSEYILTTNEGCSGGTYPSHRPAVLDPRRRADRYRRQTPRRTA